MESEMQRTALPRRLIIFSERGGSGKQGKGKGRYKGGYLGMEEFPQVYRPRKVPGNWKRMGRGGGRGAGEGWTGVE